MTELVSVSLENEMDLALAYKKSIKVAEMLGLTLSTQTTFATAVSEVSREVIDKTHDGMAVIGAEEEAGRYALVAKISYREDENFRSLEEGFQYARKLVPVLEVTGDENQKAATLRLGIPRSTRLNRARILLVKKHFETQEPATPYEEVKQRNIELARLTEEQQLLLKHSNYLNELKNEFFSVASHELKSPLTIIKGYAQLAMSFKHECSPQMLNFLKKIEVQSVKLHALIQQLFDVSKIEQGRLEYNMEQTNFDDYVRETIELIKLVTPQHNIQLKLASNSSVAVDRLRIEQVLTNIIGNAAKYSSPGSYIDLETVLENDRVVISIKDDGIGMNEETLKNVFDKFYRSNDVMMKYNGLGMGLYIASKIVNDHGGSMWAKSAEGEGSVFYFDLPLQFA